MDRKVNSDAKWFELCADTITKTDRLIQTLELQDVKQTASSIQKKEEIINNC